MLKGGRLIVFKFCLIVNNILFHTPFRAMNRQSAREMLSFLISGPKKQSVDKAAPPHFATTREIPLSRRIEGKEGCRRHYQHRVRPIDPIESVLEVEASFELPPACETGSGRINKLPPQRLSHRLLQRNGALLQLDHNHSSDPRITKKRIDLTPFRYSKMNSHPQDKREDTAPKTDLRRGYLLKRNANCPPSENSHHQSYSVPSMREADYYIPQVKKSVNEFANNREYVDAHLNHFIDSLSAFQAFAHSTVPKETHRLIELPPAPAGKLTVVFDLDETLIHTQVMNWDTTEEEVGWGKTVEVSTDNGDYRVNLKLRPHVVEVLLRLKEKFELGVFTASQEQYGSRILEELDPDHSIFSFRLFRQHCFELHSRSGHIKDLRVLKNRDLSRVVLVDNSPHTYLFQKNNAVPIVSFFNDHTDAELLKLEVFLEGLREAKDVRPVLKDYFRLEQYHHYSNMVKLVKELY